MYIIQALPLSSSLGAHDSDHGDDGDDDDWDDGDSNRHIKGQSHPHLGSPLICPPTSTNKRKRDKDNNNDKKRKKREKLRRPHHIRFDTEEEDEEEKESGQCRRSDGDDSRPSSRGVMAHDNKYTLLPQGER